MITGPLLKMLERNSKFSHTYQAPVGLQQMASASRASGQGVIVISCSDPRLNPYEILGIDSTLKATMIRNAGGRAFDAIRSLAVLQTIGAPGFIVVMHHTDCGLTHYHDDMIKKALLELSPEHADSINGAQFGEITGSIEDSVKEDVELIKNSPFINNSTQIIGLKYDIQSGVLSEVE